ncbi:hypothetical protein B9G98_03025 [Wickerhamiella sorbophila]|uniref:SH3 domain-containing protein n=1 Tax=Wickerhamiella sorbophila TaxID=45607 RepID=A0A2T0FKA6_9ASCO|nr:hypothetical protein B9G98_03025 [Wickerhamiella sorbophila]PRT55405.1 hypothetical protein B9G98_03025 [Wickerhamiella sorbophila]
MGINNPVPRDLGKESQKAAKILASFVKPNQLINYDSVIPPHVLRNAKGLMIITVLKAGFLFSGRAGSGVLVARLPDGSWSPPSAIMTGGAGVGGQIGAELTDFIFILNTREAVETFARGGSLTLGGNMSLAAGPLGRNAEAAGGVSASNATAVFSYAKTKGLFAGVSLEGSVIVERREANRKFYGSSSCTSRSILSGRVRPPRSVAPLFQVLDSKAFRADWDEDDYGDSLYDDIPDFDTDYDSRSRYSRDDDFDDVYSAPRQRDGRRYTNDYEQRSSMRASGAGRPSGRYKDDDLSDDDDDYYTDRRERSAPRRRDYGDRYDDRDRYADHSYGNRDRYDDRDRDHDRSDRGDRGDRDRYGSSSRDRYGDRSDRGDRDRYGSSHDRDRDRSGPRDTRDSRLDSPSQSRSASGSSKGGIRARALYTFRGEQTGDLSFQKGDIIHIVEKSDSTDDWWTGELGGKQGIFPANYVETY